MRETSNAKPVVVVMGAGSERMLSCREVMGALGCGRTWLHTEVTAGRVPRPIKRGRRSLWLRSEIDAYVKQVFATRLAEPPRRGAGRLVVDLTGDKREVKWVE